MLLKATSSANLHALSLLKQMCDKLGFCHALVTKLACSLDFCLQELSYMYTIICVYKKKKDFTSPGPFMQFLVFVCSSAVGLELSVATSNCP